MSKSRIEESTFRLAVEVAAGPHEVERMKNTRTVPREISKLIIRSSTVLSTPGGDT